MRKWVNGQWVEVLAKQNQKVSNKVTKYNVADLLDSDPRKAILLERMATYKAKA